MSIFLRPATSVALEVLRNIQGSLATTQRQISTGYRVGTAMDNATYWQVSTLAKSDIGANSAVQDALGLAQANVNVASTSVTSAISVVSEIKSKLVSAEEPSVDKVQVNDDITELKSQLRSIGESANFNGDNWVVLSGDSDPTIPKQVPAAFVRASDGSVSVTTLSYAGASSSSGSVAPSDVGYLIDDRPGAAGGSGVLTSTSFATEVGAAQNYVLLSSLNGDTSGQVEISLNATTTKGQIDDMLSVVNAMLDQLTNVGSAFGSLESRIDLQYDFSQRLNETQTSSVGKLIDADMEQESTKLMALQTQQQLAMQSLSIVNASYDTVRQLFQNFH